MASIISAGTTSGTSLNLSGDTSGVLQLASNGSTTAVTINTSQNVLIGTTTTSKNLRLNEKLAIASTGSGNLGGAAFTSYSGTSSTDATVLDIQRSRGTTDGSMTSVASGDTLGYVIFRGADGTNFIDAGYIAAQVDGTPGTNDMPGRLTFWTTADGASSSTERMRIASDGTISTTIGSTLFGAYSARAWVNFNGTGTPAIRASRNVSSITDNGTGDYTINFTTAMPDDEYSVVTSGKYTSNSGASDVFSTCLANWAGNPATTYVRMLTGQGNNGTKLDFEVACLSIFR